jgi:hypothetical protein
MHVWFAKWLSMHHKLEVITVVGDLVLFDNVSQGNNVCDGSFAEPY